VAPLDPHYLELFRFCDKVDWCCFFEMKLIDLVNPSVLTQPVYEPGRPIDDVARELGLDPAGVIKLASNENPLGSSPQALAAMRQALERVALYPDGGCGVLRHTLAKKFDVTAEQIAVGNGSNELLELLGHLFLRPGDEVVMGTPAFIVYKLVTLLFGAKPIEIPLVNHVHDLDAMAAAITPATKLVCLPTPNNPTGTTNPPAKLREWALSLPDHVVLVIDEAYGEYLEDLVDWNPLIAAGRKVIVLRTFSKIYGLAGLRIGFARASAAMAGLLQRVRQPFNVNSLAQAGAIGATTDDEWVRSCRLSNSEGLAQLSRGLTELGLEFVPSFANFLLVKVGDGAAVFKSLQQVGIIVRPVAAYGMPAWIRITIGNPDENVRVLGALRSLLVENLSC